MAFTQIIELDRVDDEQALHDHMTGWDTEQAGVAPGYLGARLLADRDAPGRYVLLVDFSSAEEAKRNSDREETSSWAARLQELTGVAPAYRNMRPVGSTSG